MPEQTSNTQLLGEIKGRLDTYIAMMESDRNQLWGKVDDHEDRIVSLESQYKSAASVLSFVKWAVAALSAACGFLINHLWSNLFK